MNLYEKIGRLIKHNKIFDLGNDSNLTDSSKNDGALASEIEEIESILYDIISSNKFEIASGNTNYVSNNKIFSKSDFEEAQNLIKKCSHDEQLILIAILDIQLSLVGNENKYIKYEKINEKIIEKNIYWVISCEIHKRVHKENSEFKEYCHFVKDQKEKYILGSDYNFKYDNLDSIICKLKNMNKIIEFIAIKSIFISLYNLSCEYIQKYIEIIEYNKKYKINDYLVFEYIINDYLYIIDAIKFLNIDFKQSLDNFINSYHINLTFESLFKDIFLNSIFHNQILGFKYIHTFIHIDTEIKILLVKMLDLVSSLKFPLIKNLSKILLLENLIGFKSDLATKIKEQSEQTRICVGVGKCEIKNDEDKGEIKRKKEIIYIRGKIGKKDGDDKFDLSEDNNGKIKMQKILMDLDKENDNKTIFGEKIIINKINNEKEIKIQNTSSEDEKEKINSINENIKKDKASNNTKDKYNENIKFEKINKIDINNSKIQQININDTNTNEDKKGNNNTNINLEDKSLDEVYEYINGDKKTKNKKKNRRRNKGKLKKNKNKNDNNVPNNDDIEDPIVEQFKNDIKDNFILASSITKIKPYISEDWIKAISSF